MRNCAPMLSRILLVMGCLLVSLSSSALAKPLSDADIPPALREWKAWALRDVVVNRCPGQHNDHDKRACYWPGTLEIRLEDTHARFSLEVEIYGEDERFITLPGSASDWPQSVKLNGQPAIVTEHTKRPAVLAPTGHHRLEGELTWNRLPDMLQLPPQTGIVRVWRESAAILFPDIDPAGRLLLNREPQEDAAAVEDSLSLHVFRKFSDDIPQLLETRLQLRVAGKPRELLLAPALLPGFTPQSLESPLPARLEEDGRLRVQVRPGDWALTLTAHQQTLQNNFTLPEALAAYAKDSLWAGEEIWAVETFPPLRDVRIGGVTAMDPQQTLLPDTWKRLPAYRLRPGDTLQLDEQKRGDSSPAEDNLTLSREWRLHFDHTAFSIHDRLNGEIRRSNRLSMHDHTSLGQVSIHGAGQYITRLHPEDPAGIEVRKGPLQLEAESRFPLQQSVLSPVLPAIGWQHDMQSLSASLMLPPGWSLFYAQGVDSVSKSWISSWSLLDIFVVLITVTTISRLFSRLSGGIALLTLLLSHPVVPDMSWAALTLLAAIALRRVLPKGKFLTLVTFGYRLVLFGAILGIVGFLFTDIRLALHPQLQHYGSGSSAGYVTKQMQTNIAAPQQMLEKSVRVPTSAVSRKTAEMADMLGRAQEEKGSYRQYQFDPSLKVQTGYGVADWQGRQIQLGWSGPVSQDQQFRLWLLSAPINLGIACLRAVLLVWLLGLLLELPRRWSPVGGLRGYLHKPATLLLLLALPLPAFAAEGAYPPAALLEDLKARLEADLKEAPSCKRQCASVARTALATTSHLLSVRQQWHVAAPSIVPLPGHPQDLALVSVRVDGNAPEALRRNSAGLTEIVLMPGVHDVVTTLALPEKTTVTLNFPLPPRRIDTALEHWQAIGIREDGSAENSLQLQRIRSKSASRTEETATLEAGVMPVFLTVDRLLDLGVEWRITTTVTRIAPERQTILQPVPLLPGERVTTDGIEVENGAALVRLSPNALQTRWQSTLPPQERLTLKATASPAVMERWFINVSNLWHAEFSGIPPIHQEGAAGVLPGWRPWPGEELTLAISRPVGVEGSTLTIEQSELQLIPGERQTDARLTLRLRSSQGGTHSLTLPEGAKPKSLRINGLSQPVTPESASITLPVSPGEQQVELQWLNPNGIAGHYRSPAVNLGLESVNARLKLAVPRDRWVLFETGPMMGPAVLIWAALPVILLLSLLLGKSGATPLKSRQWFLLLLGLSTAPLYMSFFVVLWFLALARRRGQPSCNTALGFNFRQCALGLLTLFSLIYLAEGIRRGLLGQPDMRIEGNGSSSHVLYYYQDVVGAWLPQASVWSLPLLAYRGLMLLWALWLAFSLIGWLRWAWGSFSEGGYWQRVRTPKEPEATTPTEEEQPPYPEPHPYPPYAPEPGREG